MGVTGTPTQNMRIMPFWVRFLSLGLTLKIILDLARSILIRKLQAEGGLTKIQETLLETDRLSYAANYTSALMPDVHLLG